MKLLIAFFFSGLLAVSASSYSQQTKLSVKLDEVTVKEAFKQIEKISEFVFFYNEDYIDVSRKVSINARDEKVESILNDLLKGTQNSYKIYDRQIVISVSETKESPTLIRSVINSEQKKEISGIVTDSKGLSIPGVTIIVKGTNIGIITDIEGKFQLSVSADAKTLVFSFVGMKTQEISINGKTSFMVAMEEEAIDIEEVVAIGYGTQKKSDLTGSVVRVNLDKQTTISNVILSSALQGVTAGVNVGGVGLAGDAPDLSIRGKTSLSATDAPLLVLDGIIYNGSISDINVNDVESIDILKDASATAVYGSRSANGVMIITTKRGKSEKPLFNVSSYFGFQDYTNSPERVMNGDEFAIRLVDFFYQQSLYAWYATKPTSEAGKPVRIDISDRNAVSTFVRTEEEKENYLSHKYVNWMKEIEQKAPIQNYDISVSGKTDKTNYYISGSYTDQKGRLLNDQFNRTTIHTSLENKITDWITIGINLTYSNLDYSGIEASFSEAMTASPLVNFTTALGTYPINIAETKHPLQNTVCDDKDIRKNLFMLGYAKIVIPKIKGLTYDFNYSNTYYATINSTFYPSTTSTGNINKGNATKNYAENTSWIINNIINYSRTFANNHSVSATLLYSREKRSGESSSLTASGFDNEVLGYNSMELGTLQTVSTGAWEENSLAYMARLNYSFKNRYLLTGTIRKDGFSGFGANRQTAIFPSLSLGWVLSDEAFLKNLKVINFLKLRTSVGKNGNQGIGRYSSFSKMGTTSYVFGSTTAIGLFPNTLGNADLGWESTLSYNMGIDFSVLSKRISGSIDLYKAQTSNVLVSRALPGTAGYTSVWTNIGGIANKGIELSLTTVNIEKPLRWESKFIFSLNRDKITRLYGGGEDKDVGNGWFVGEPISAIYDYKAAGGIWTEQEFYNKEIPFPMTYPGHLKITDLNGDSILNVNSDRSVIGYKTPNYCFSISNDLSYKNFTLSIFINSIMGGNGYYMADNGRAIVACYTVPGTGAGSGDAGILNAYKRNLVATRQYWTPDNGVTNAPSLYFLPYQVMGFYQDRSFVRLQDVSLTYSFGNDILSTLRINGLKVYVSGKNLYTWTKWDGWDPEMADNGTRMMRSIIAGFRLTF